MKQVFTLALLAAVACSGAELTTLSKCIEKGFQPGEVACSTCERLSAAVSTLGASESEAVVSDCKSCCSDVLDYTSPVKYATVELRLCKYSLGSHGGVNEFVEKSAWKDQIAITDIMGHAPTLILSHPATTSTVEGVAPEVAAEPPLSIVVASWKIEQIEAFLRAKTVLAPSEPTEGR